MSSYTLRWHGGGEIPEQSITLEDRQALCDIWDAIQPTLPEDGWAQITDPTGGIILRAPDQGWSVGFGNSRTWRDSEEAARQHFGDVQRAVRERGWKSPSVTLLCDGAELECWSPAEEAVAA